MGYPILIVAAVVVLLVIIAGILEFLAAYGHIVLCVLAAMAVVALIRWFYVSENEAEERDKAREKANKERAEAKQAEAVRRSHVVVTADAFLEEARSLLTACFIIDSNIWMNEAYDAFFSTLKIICENGQYVIAMDGAQFDEIVNIKAATGFKHRRNRAARLGMNRIEEFQKLGYLRLERLTVNAVRGAYADPLLVNVLSAQAAKGIPCTFISDDRELRIRVREHLNRVPNAKWRIVEMQEVLAQCRTVVEAIQYRST